MFENNPIVEGLKKLYFEIRLTLRLMRDPRVPLWSKIIPVAAVAYVLLPIDFIPDFILIIGQLDDLTVLYTALRLFRRYAPPDVVEEHQRALEDQYPPEDVIVINNSRK